MAHGGAERVGKKTLHQLELRTVVEIGIKVQQRSGSEHAVAGELQLVHSVNIYNVELH